MDKRKEHWENIYSTKEKDEVSWFQLVPFTSLDLISKTHSPLDAKIVDIGGGDSFLAEHLLARGYKYISVVDISAKAIERAKANLGPLANAIQWYVSDIVHFESERKFDIWHDRAVFHFLTKDEDIDIYKALVKKSVKQNGYFILGTFSEQGPTKCSGIEIKQYSKESMQALFQDDFTCIQAFNEDHSTPFDTKQNFTFCLFQKK